MEQKCSKYLEKSSKPDILHSDYTATSFKVNVYSVREPVVQLKGILTTTRKQKSQL